MKQRIIMLGIAGSLLVMPFVVGGQMATSTSHGTTTPPKSPVMMGGVVAERNIQVGGGDSCPVVTSFMKMGHAGNRRADVVKLQTFLRDKEGAMIEVTGTFDAKTDDAVKAFQKKHLALVMGPWGATRGSGIVHITTGKKINEVACGTPLVLNQTELATINRYRQGQGARGTLAASQPVGGVQTTTVSPRGEVTVTFGSQAGSVRTIPTSSVDTMDTNGEKTMTAAAGETSLAQRFWQFIKGLF